MAGERTDREARYRRTILHRKEDGWCISLMGRCPNAAMGALVPSAGSRRLENMKSL